MWSSTLKPSLLRVLWSFLASLLAPGLLLSSTPGSKWATDTTTALFPCPLQSIGAPGLGTFPSSSSDSCLPVCVCVCNLCNQSVSVHYNLNRWGVTRPFSHTRLALYGRSSLCLYRIQSCVSCFVTSDCFRLMRWETTQCNSSAGDPQASFFPRWHNHLHSNPSNCTG